LAHIIEVKNLKTQFKTEGGLVKAVDGVSYYIDEHEIVGLVGESGCGKSVSQLSMMQLIPTPPGKIVDGEVIFEGQDLLKLKRYETAMRSIRGGKIAMIFQEPMTSLNPVLTINLQMTEMLMLHLQMDRHSAWERAIELLNLVGIPDAEQRINHYPHQLSGGMRQRVMIAMGLSCNPKLLIADEPTTALDVTTQAQLLELMKDMSNRFGTSLTIVTHNLGVVARYANRIYVMYAGRIELSSISQNSVLVEVQDLRMYFPVTRGFLRKKIADIKAVDGVSFKIRKNETLGLVGESGCGKTTVGRCLLRVYHPTSGHVAFDGNDITKWPERKIRPLRSKMQLIFQDPYGSLNPRKNAGTFVGEPLKIHHIVKTKKEYEDRIDELFRLVQLDPGMTSRFPHQFSGGQRQRIGIARALASNPKLIVCDEPISALDVSIQAQIVNLLMELQRKLGLTYLFIAHDLSVVRHISDRVAVMYLGHIVETTGWQELYENPLHPYTKALLSAVPIPDPFLEEHRERIILKGDVPSLINTPTGCCFHPRCYMAIKECSEVIPPLREIGSDHGVACIRV